MHGSHHAFIEQIAGGLGLYYLCLAAANALAALYLWQVRKNVRLALVWLGFAAVFMVLAPLAMGGGPPGLPDAVEAFAFNTLSGNPGAIVYTAGSAVMLVVLYLGRNFFVRPTVAWTGLNLVLLFMGVAITDREFKEIVTKADNIPIVALVFMLGFFTWLSASKAVENDRRRAEGLPPLEKQGDEKILVWPDLVYTELICMVVLTVVLIVWAVLIKAPLETPATDVKTPNPSKAPWYFLGLQEMLVYYDPWMAGVVLPSLVLFGLMAIPFLDFNKGGSGYYTIAERRFAYCIFQVGFLLLWVTLIVLGTFLRGPNWNFFSPFEYWDVHKVLALNNVNLSDIVWVNFLRQTPPFSPEDAALVSRIGTILMREGVGIVLVLGYFILLPPLMVTGFPIPAVTRFFRTMFLRLGFIRYMVMMNLLLFMAALPLKMILRWAFNLKYVVYIPEYFLNF